MLERQSTPRPRLRLALFLTLLAAMVGACGGGSANGRSATDEPIVGDDAPDDTATTHSDSDQSASGTHDEPAGDVLRVYFIDVGQGDGALVVTPNQRTILIDAGLPNAGDNVVATLREAGVESINLMVTSHAHADHIGGFEDVLDNFEVMRYADPGFEHSSSMYADLLDRIINGGVDGYVLGMGQWLQIDDEVEMRVLAPPESYLSGTRSDVNSNSIVLLLRYRDVTILFTGDAEADTEVEMLSHGMLEDVDVLKVAHHGGGYSSTPAFLEAVHPEYAVISCGEGNSYGHPDPDTLERLEGYTGSDHIYRTDLLGTIVLETDGEHIVIMPQSEMVPSDAPVSLLAR